MHSSTASVRRTVRRFRHRETRPRRSALTRRNLLTAFVFFLLLTLWQSPGKIVADTKLDLTANPGGFLTRAMSLWNEQSFGGQLQNQAYGYLFPQGPFFLVSSNIGVPDWVTQRLWWALVLTVGFWGIVRLAEALRIGSRSSRVVGALAYALSPRALTTVGAISSETWVMMLAPWVLLPVVLVFLGRRPPLRGAVGSAVAIALMGAVNAVATAAAILPAVLWFLMRKPDRRWLIFGLLWFVATAAAVMWWAVPLIILGQYSPPFLDYIESARVTTRWLSLPEIVRGTTNWIPFVSGERVAGAALVTVPVFVLATGVVAAAGIVGLASRTMPARSPLIVMTLMGVTIFAVSYSGPLGSPVADSVLAFLDGSGAPLRNIHKFDLLIRLPVALGIAHALALVPLPGAVPFTESVRAFARPETHRMVAVSLVVLLAAGVATAPAWRGQLAPEGGFDRIPSYWVEAARWLTDNTSPDTPATGGFGGTRSLVVPGASFAQQAWGSTRDEPLQALATTPWTVRDSIPLAPAPAIRALDSVQQLFADGRPAPGLAQTLLSQGIGYLVVRNDLDVEQSQAPRPILVHRVIDGSPGIERVAVFGPLVGEPAQLGEVAASVTDSGLRPLYPAVEIYRVGDRTGPSPTAPYLIDLDGVPVVAGGPEVLARMDDLSVVSTPDELAEDPSARTRLLLADVLASGVGPSELFAPLRLTDTPALRDTNFGQVDHHSSAIGDPAVPLQGWGAVRDYSASVEGLDPTLGDDERGATDMVTRGRWPGARLEVSSSAANVTQPGAVLPGNSAAAAVDSDTSTQWRSSGVESATEQWLDIVVDEPIDQAVLTMVGPSTSVGPAVTAVTIRTDTGSATGSLLPGKASSVALPPGKTSRIRIAARSTADGTRGRQFAIAELSLFSNGDQIPITRQVVLPSAPADISVRRDWQLAGWTLTQQFPGRAECFLGRTATEDFDPTKQTFACSSIVDIAEEDRGLFQRLIQVPRNIKVSPSLLLRPRGNTAVENLLRSAAGREKVSASGQSLSTDPRASAYAAVDADPRTAWIAQSEGEEPTLNIELPRDVEVGGLILDLPDSATPATPVEFRISTGKNSTTVRTEDGDYRADGRVEFAIPAERTTRVELTITRWKPTADAVGPGFNLWYPTGLRDVTVLSVDGAAIGSVTGANAPIILPCGEGPVVYAAGSRVQTSVLTTRESLLSGEPILAKSCGESLSIPAGEVAVTVDPGEAFTVESVALDSPEASAKESTRDPAIVSGWGPDRRVMEVPDHKQTQLLVIPQSFNSGWEATISGKALTAIPVNGWQQGFVVPVGVAGTMLVTFAPAEKYRFALLAGLIVLILLFFVYSLVRLVGPSDRLPLAKHSKNGPGLRLRRTLAAAVTLGFGTLISGPAGLALGAALVLGAAICARRFDEETSLKVLRLLMVVGAVGGTAALATDPWLSSAEYAGDEALPQALAALSVISFAAVLMYRPLPERP